MFNDNQGRRMNFNNQNKKMIRMALRTKILLIFIAVIIVLAAIVIYLYRDAIFRDYGDIDSTTSENSISILFVGNSHVMFGKIPRQLRTISRMYGVEVVYKDISEFGAPLSRTRDTAVSEMQSGRFDYAIFQDQTGRPQRNIEDFLDDIRVLCDEAKANGVIPVLYNAASAYIDRKPDEKRQSIITEAYKRAADENGAILVNAGDAWIYTYTSIPGISLYAWDRQHANNAGAFLTTCVFAATMFDLHVIDIPSDIRYKGSDAIELANTAWEFVHLQQPE
jgi:hypothetical protein